MTAFTLARWFQMERYANLPEDDTVREQVLGEVYRAERVGVYVDTTTRKTSMIVKTPNGACMIEATDVDGCPLVTFDYVEDARWTRTRFWMNASSVATLGDYLRTVERAPFDDLFFGEGAVVYGS